MANLTTGLEYSIPVKVQNTCKRSGIFVAASITLKMAIWLNGSVYNSVIRTHSFAAQETYTFQMPILIGLNGTGYLKAELLTPTGAVFATAQSPGISVLDIPYDLEIIDLTFVGTAPDYVPPTPAVVVTSTHKYNAGNVFTMVSGSTANDYVVTAIDNYLKKYMLYHVGWDAGNEDYTNLGMVGWTEFINIDPLSTLKGSVNVDRLFSLGG